MNLEPIKINADASPWLPASVLKRINEEGCAKFTGSFSAADKKIMRTRRPIKMSQWVEKNIVVTSGPRPGPWRNRTTPYLVGIMDAGIYKSVRTIIVCATPQTAKTSLGHNSIAYCIDRVPGDALYVFPDINTAKENIRDRIIPTITASPQLNKYLTGAVDDLANIRVKLQHMVIYAAWASSAARLANKPIRYVVFDEIDKYPEVADKRETDSISLGEKRVQTFKRMGKEKIWKFSSPTVELAPIWQALTKEAQVTFDYWVRCPYCNKLQLMIFPQIKWKKTKEEHPDPETMLSQNLAWYECQYCKARWDDDRRDHAVRIGEWHARPSDWVSRKEWKHDPSGMELFAYLKKYSPGKIGFHIPSWISAFVSLSEPAAAFLKYKKSNKKDDLKDFNNGYCAEPWVIFELERDEDVILALRDDRPRGMVPGGDVVAGLTVAVDTHDNGFYYEVRAWGWGLLQESWGIREGFAPSFAALEQIFFEDQYFDEDGKQYVIQGFIIDAMGHRTKEVYQWCSQHRRVFPFKGEQKMNQPVSFTKRQHYPGTQTPIPGGVMLLRANVNYYKDDLSSKLEIAPADPGAWHMHSETSRAWAEQMTAEFVNEKGLWECRPSVANEAWDISVYNLVIADVLGMKFRKKKGDPAGAVKNKTRRIISKGID